MTTPNQQLVEPPDYSIPIAPEMRETFRALDALGPGWIVAVSASTTAPPSSSPQGATYICPEGATGAWAGHAKHVAIFTPEGWIFRAPRAGWICVVADEGAPFGTVYEYVGVQWTPWLLPADQVSFTPGEYETDFVATNLFDLMVELSDRFVADELILTNHENRLEALEDAGGGGGGGGNVTPDTHPIPPDDMDDEFEDGSLDTSKWTWVNQNDATATLVAGSLLLADPTHSGDDFAFVTQPLPSGAWEFVTKCGVMLREPFCQGGILLRRSSSGGLVVLGATSNSGFKTIIAGYSNPTTYGGYNPRLADDTGIFGACAQFRWYRITFNGSNSWTFGISASGVPGTFITLHAANINSAFLGGDPDQVGLYINASNTTNPVSAAFDYFRRIA